jgi:hypothetical protein
MTSPGSAFGAKSVNIPTSGYSAAQLYDLYVHSRCHRIPYWSTAITAAIVATVPWLRSISFRFSLRSLFIATTFLAIVLGMIAWLDRAWIG